MTHPTLSALPPCHPQTTGARLRAARADANLTMGQVARMTGGTVPVISAEENDLCGVSPARIALLASCYGVSVDWLVGKIGP